MTKEEGPKKMLQITEETKEMMVYRIYRFSYHPKFLSFLYGCRNFLSVVYQEMLVDESSNIPDIHRDGRGSYFILVIPSDNETAFREFVERFCRENNLDLQIIKG